MQKKSPIIPLFLEWHHEVEEGTYSAKGKRCIWRIKKILSRFFLQRKKNGEDWLPIKVFARIRDAKIEAENRERVERSSTKQ